MKFGYARVSTSDQDASLQRDALKAAGCEQITVDKVSGAAKKRPKLDKLVKSLNEGDVLTVWRLDRVGRSLPHLLTFVQDLQDRGIGFQSLHETIDTTSANGKLMFHVFAALIEFERDLLIERIRQPDTHTLTPKTDAGRLNLKSKRFSTSQAWYSTC